MYAPASPFSRPLPAGDRTQSSLYRQVGVETSISGASPHQLVKLLLDGFFESLTDSRGAIRKGDVEAKAQALTRALRIVDEGLKASLDLQAGRHRRPEPGVCPVCDVHSPCLPLIKTPHVDRRRFLRLGLGRLGSLGGRFPSDLQLRLGAEFLQRAEDALRTFGMSREVIVDAAFVGDEVQRHGLGIRQARWECNRR